jgi:hypothetical protein
VKALASEEVASYLNEHFVSSYQKVANFRIVNGQKVGGNVASYFTLPDGSVLHVVAGPVDAATLLREARWVVETRKMAITVSRGTSGKYKGLWRKAHAERLQAEHGVAMNLRHKPTNVSQASPGMNQMAINQLRLAGHSPQAQVHQLLAAYPLVRIDKVYQVVFERILGQKINTAPVDDGTKAARAIPILFAPETAQRPGSLVDVPDEKPVVEVKPLTAAERAEKDERDAARRLKLAKVLAEEANTTNVSNLTANHDNLRDPERLLGLAMNHFQEIVTTYPNTKAAKEARRLLEERGPKEGAWDRIPILSGQRATGLESYPTASPGEARKNPAN